MSTLFTKCTTSNNSIFSKPIFRWPSQFEATSAHQLRDRFDMQFAFTYFYFMIHQKFDFDFSQVFDEFLDVDGDGVLNDNELRTLAVHIKGIPLEKDVIMTIKQEIFSEIYGPFLSSSFVALEKTEVLESPPIPLENMTASELFDYELQQLHFRTTWVRNSQNILEFLADNDISTNVTKVVVKKTFAAAKIEKHFGKTPKYK